MIASLGMYDMPHLRDAHDRLWSGIRAALGHGPDHLTRDGDAWAEWQSPDLLLAQTCGLPFRARLHGKVTLVSTPDYDLPDCPAGHYCSYLIRRRSDARDLKTLSNQGVMAYNDALSQSGWAAPVMHLKCHGAHPRNTIRTDAHIASIEAVLSGAADYAGIDALTYLLWAQVNPDKAQQIDTFARTSPTPALPYITALGRDPVPIANAIRSGIAALPADDRATLRLKGLIDIPASEYLALPIPPAP
ncbi:PhnD/SsuA/transferrin family substrate-binding protein [uncultured Tateyamaria sp.]|uniref:PhnD/SsuA/transferrin family substrate-binding protein n=1 Tax=uncultured Tateyamaria sp. TaxID=455651 RepID=UPI0026091002|nr:PhnD/SsuA/transferrin family substrate-binding protein [uncultured Tateyamaria sp.]